MATKKVKGVSLTPFERIGGGVLFALYLLVLPFIRDGLFRAAEHLLGTTISRSAEYNLYYYILFVIILLVFYHYVGATTSYFFGTLTDTLAAAGTGLVFFYGLNELLYRTAHVLFGHTLNLNDYAVSAQVDDAPRITLLIVVLIAPFIEEVLFRGYVFGSLKGHSRALAYVVSCVLFAFLHVWQFAGGGLSFSRVLLLVQYLVPGAVLAWSYDRSGNLWGPLLIHVAANALHVWLG